MIERFLLEKVREFLAAFPVVAILGPRQVGKTTLAKALAPKLKKETIYLDLERPSHFKALASNPEVYLEKHKNFSIIIDEVQRFPGLFPILRPMVDEYRVPGRFLLLGSASPTLLKDSSESLAGRIMYTELSTLNLIEVNELYDLWLRGGFPEPFSMKDAIKRENWYSSFLRTYFERDLKSLGLNTRSDLVSRTFSMMAHMQGGLCNMSRLSNSLASDRRTIEKILHFFVSSYMVRKLEPFFPNVKKRLVKSPKYYIRDSGVLHYTLGVNTLKQLFEHPALGFSWEGFVIDQILNMGLNMLPYFYRTQAGAECDLVLVKGNQPCISIEAKITNTPKMTKSFSESIHALETKENYIVVPSCDYPYMVKANAMVCNLTWLLENLKKTHEQKNQ